MTQAKTTSLWLLGTAAMTVGLLTGPALATDLGELSPLIPLPKDAIHAGLSWTKDSKPKICFGMRPAEYPGGPILRER